MEESNLYDVIIIGAGIMGSSTAYYISKHFGKKVLLLEQFDSVHKRGSSHGDSRIIRMTYREDHYTSMMFDAYKLWNEIEAEVPNSKLFTKTGGLCIGKIGSAPIDDIVKNLRKYKVEHSLLSKEDIKNKFPTLKIREESSYLYQPDAGVLNANKCVSTILSLASKYGAIFLDNEPVKSIKELSSNSIEVETADKKFRGTKLIITSGAWTQKLVSLLGINLPLSPIQVTVAYWKVEDPSAYSYKNFPIFISFDDPSVYGTPALEYPNRLKVAGDYGESIDPDTRDFEPNESSIAQVKEFIQNYFEGVEFSRPSHTESCMYTHSPDRGFILDKLPNRENIYIGCGFSGHGFKLGPLVGKILGTMAVTGVHPYPEFEPFLKLGRFE